MNHRESGGRILALDVVRGFALCGILVANVRPIAIDDETVIQDGPAGARFWLGLFVEQRFFPIFSLLFGVGFALLLRSAEERDPRPRLVLARRLVTLLAIGLVHRLALWDGDVLTIYAAVGLLILLPTSSLPRRMVFGLTAFCLAVALGYAGGGYDLVPGLFLLGATLVRYGAVDRLEEITWKPAAVLLVPTAVALGLQAVLRTGTPGHAANVAFMTAGLLVAALYVCTLCRLLRTPLRSPLRTAFAPLGRMALTNYVTATVIVLALARLHGHPQDWTWGAVFAIAAAVLTVQWLWSTLWLRHYRQGPLEWLWRWATWARRPPLRIPAAPHG